MGISGGVVIRTLVDGGLILSDGPRWHDGKLWFSDLFGRTVYTVDLDGTLDEVLALETQPSGLAFLADGSWLVVSQKDQRLLRIGPDGAIAEYADLSGIAVFDANDIVLDSKQRAYVTCFGFDMGAGADVAPAPLMRVDVDGTVSVAADGLFFPNAVVLTDDERTLMVSESAGNRIQAFDIEPDGSLTNRRVWADLGERTPDGMCLDAEGALWIACIQACEFVRVAEGGEVLDRVETPTRWATACMLGGPERRHLFMLTSETTPDELSRGISHGRVEVVEVPVPGAGRP